LQYGLPACNTANGCFRKVNQDGVAGSYPASDSGWGFEIALDIDMVSATCPACSILLVEANDSEFVNMGLAVNTAVALGAIAVSNSYGGAEVSSEAQYDQYFNHPGVAITVATGDCGYQCANGTPFVQYPAASPYVVAVGGTSLIHDSSARSWGETAWGNSKGGAGSGCSRYEPKPSWQHDSGCSMRTQADVSAVADPLTGVAVYDSYYAAWRVAGGTSASAPIIAATYALAGSPGVGSYPASNLYSSAANLNDVTSGNNDVTFGSCPKAYPYLCSGVAGYDGPTGLGTPNGINAFVSPGILSTFTALTPKRILDTRYNKGLSGAFSSHVARPLQVTGKTTGIPADATAVTGNLTVTGQTAAGFLSIGPNAMNNPTSSTLNFPLGDDRANAVTVAVGVGGALWVTYAASTMGPSADVLFDVTGYFEPGTGGASYTALAPTRLLDTRYKTGLTGSFHSHVSRYFHVTGGTSGIPSDATAVTGNLTVTGQTTAGFLYLGPTAMNDPTSSTLNFPLGDDRANAVTVALGTGGVLWATYAASTLGPTAQLIFDVTGYFEPGTGGASYVPLNPTRILDTRYGTGLSGTFKSHVSRHFHVTGGASRVPTTATAFTGNLTVTGQTAAGFLYIGPSAMNDPTSSTLNFPLGDDRANAVTAARGSGGVLWVTYAASTLGPTAHVIFDLTGYFVPTT
jgi:hypothetical protein